MSKDNVNISTNNSNNASLSYNTNINSQYFNESVNRALDQTKDNINRSIEESKNQIPQFNNIVNSYQEQTLQAVKEMTENYIESQKTIIRSIQSAWGPYQQILTHQSIHGTLRKQQLMHIVDLLAMLETIQ